MRKLFAAGFLVCVSLLAARAQTPSPKPPDPAKEKRLEWFREAKYGMFIHWGLYAIPAGEWNGRRCLGLGEWVMNRCQVPVKEYEKLAARFDPVKFNADEWVQLAQDAGMKYMVITSKHHDGFAMFKSAASPYNVVDATPYKKDILKQLADACARHGMRLGFYYSQSQDWHEPGGAGNTWDFGPDTAPDGKTELKKYEDYLRGKAEPQVKELLTNYGPVALIWFDTPRMMTPERGQRFADLVRTLQPATLIDGRLGTEGDYRSTGDNVIPAEASAEAWETPATINDTWGFRRDDTNWKSPGQIAFKLVDIVIGVGVAPRAREDREVAERPAFARERHPETGVDDPLGLLRLAVELRVGVRHRDRASKPAVRRTCDRVPLSLFDGQSEGGDQRFAAL